jgi:hypothetical protein
MTIPIGLTIWSAVLSTTLAIVKLWELYNTRPRLVISSPLVNSPDDVCAIHNIGAKAVLITEVFIYSIVGDQVNPLNRNQIIEKAFFLPSGNSFNCHFDLVRLVEGTKWYAHIHIADRKKPIRLLIKEY